MAICYVPPEGGFIHEELYFFAQLGATFCLLKRPQDYGGDVRVRKQPLSYKWQHKPRSVEEAQRHLERGGGVGLLTGAHSNHLLALDIDELGLPCAFEAVPELADWPRVQHAGKPNRGKLIFYSDGRLSNCSRKVRVPNFERGKAKYETYFELLADGKQAVIPPSLHPCGERYYLVNANLPIPNVTSDRFLEIWDLLDAQCPENWEDPEEKKRRAEQIGLMEERKKQIAERRKKQQSGQNKSQNYSTGVLFVTEDGISYEDFDWEAHKQEVKDNIDILTYAQENFSGSILYGKNGEVKIQGNGGLWVNVDSGEWHIFNEEIGGDIFSLISYVKFGHADAKRYWPEVYRIACEEAGVPMPQFSPYRWWEDAPLPEPPPDVAMESWGNYYPDLIRPIRIIETLDITGKKLSEVITMQELIEKFRSYSEGDKVRGLLIAGTGMGKTYMMVNENDEVLVVEPTQDLVRQLAKEYRLPVVMEGIEPQFVSASIKMGTTIDSLPKIEARADEKGINLYKTPLALDEAHILATAEYRHAALAELVKRLDKYEVVIGITATPLPSLPGFEGAPAIQFVSNRPPRDLYFVQTEDYISCLLEARVKYELVITHYNDKAQIHAWVETFTQLGYKALAFTRDTREEPHHQQMIQNGRLPDDVEFVFVTSIYDVGLSIKYHKPYIQIVSAKSGLAPEQVEQVAARIRNIPPSETWIVRTTKEVEATHFGDYMRELNAALQCAYTIAELETEAIKKVLEHLKTQFPDLPHEEITKKAIDMMSKTGLYKYNNFNTKTMAIEVDRLKIHQEVFNKYARACLSNPDRMAAQMAQWNYINQGRLQITVPKEEKQAYQAHNCAVKEEKEAYKAAKSQEIREQVETIQDYTHAEYIIQNRQNTGHTEEEYTAAKLMLSLSKTGVMAECAKRLLLYCNQVLGSKHLTNRTPKQLTTKINFTILRRYGEIVFQSGVLAKYPPSFFFSIMNAFQVGDILTFDAVNTAFEEAFQYCPSARPKFSSPNPNGQWQKRIRLISDCYKVKRDRTQHPAIRVIEALYPVDIELEPEIEKLLTGGRRETRGET